MNVFLNAKIMFTYISNFHEALSIIIRKMRGIKTVEDVQIKLSN